MEIKYKKNIKDFKYILMFDLASKVTGVCLWSLEKRCPVYTTALRVVGNEELPAFELLTAIKNCFHHLSVEGYDTSKILVVKEAMPTQLRGGSSTVQTFIALARSHGVLDTMLYGNGIATYDYTGIYPITWHNYFKKINSYDKDAKVTKEDVHDYVVKKYNLSSSVTLDETDAVFLCETFLAIKWNADIQEQIREVKRHKKTLKAPHAINACDVEIERLNALKIVDNE